MSPVHEVLPLLLAVPTASAAAYFGITGYKSMNPKTAQGDNAAEQAKNNREARHQAARDSANPNG
jgi:hypothetical protein